MQSFLLKSICCILIINVTFCRSYCFKAVCKAGCYFRHHGFDYGYCEKGFCKCAPPVIYVFDGIGRDLSDEDINNSLVNNNVIQNSQKKNGAVNVNSNNVPILNKAPNLPNPKATTQASPTISPSSQIVPPPRATTSPQATTSPKATPSPKNSKKGTSPKKQQNSNPNTQQPKLKTKKTPTEEDNKNEEIVVELSEESFEEDDSANQSGDYSQSGSQSYESSEEINPVVPQINK